jgi:hypothetical protein
MKIAAVHNPALKPARERAFSPTLSDASAQPQPQVGPVQHTPRSRLKAMGFLMGEFAPCNSTAYCSFSSVDGAATWFIPANNRRIEKVLRDEVISRPSGLRGLCRRFAAPKARDETRLSIPFVLDRVCPSAHQENTLIEVRPGVPVVSLHLHDTKARSLGVLRCAKGDEGRSAIESERRVLDSLSSIGLRSAKTPQVLGQSESGAYSLLFISSLSARSVRAPRRFTVAHQQFLDELEYRTKPSGLATVTLRESIQPVATCLNRNQGLVGVSRYSIVKRVCDFLYAFPELDIPSGLGHGAFEPRHARLLNGELLVSGWGGAGYRRSLATDLVRFELALPTPAMTDEKRAQRLAAAVAAQWPALPKNAVWAVLALSMLEILAEQCGNPSMYFQGDPANDEGLNECEPINHHLLTAVERELCL